MCPIKQPEKKQLISTIVNLTLYIKHIEKESTIIIKFKLNQNCVKSNLDCS